MSGLSTFDLDSLVVAADNYFGKAKRDRLNAYLSRAGPSLSRRKVWTSRQSIGSHCSFSCVFSHCAKISLAFVMEEKPFTSSASSTRARTEQEKPVIFSTFLARLL
jgi:hypothetical protein